ncbi:MAG: hypothetical protein OMM_13509, partial [Candidatus Magnetoglobus multicellularis str. Araruama]
NITEILIDLINHISLKLNINHSLAIEQIENNCIQSYFFDHFLPYICAEMSPQKCIIVFDECDAVKDINDDMNRKNYQNKSFASFINAFIDHIKKFEYPVKIIIAIGADYQLTAHMNYDRKIELNCLSKQDCIFDYAEQYQKNQYQKNGFKRF